MLLVVFSILYGFCLTSSKDQSEKEGARVAFFSLVHSKPNEMKKKCIKMKSQPVKVQWFPFN
jgi:hypothetical protein